MEVFDLLYYKGGENMISVYPEYTEFQYAAFQNTIFVFLCTYFFNIIC